ncbi:Dabb family protein [Desulfosporosinus sp. BG]|uniref:Dabb family protein n=1 Tax=Desulfosporosinus sp. BG TaxID=1633135 RepID=UPI00083B0A9F|nr:Dabb family protein [Desulfosporosinus sp. BG]ODA41901.1 Stress responsive alpha-beta barrel domain protein Dabb [Desulfosporosinus sp. BG]
MIINNLLIKLKEQNNEIIEETRTALLGMKGKIEVLRDLQVEVDIRHGESSYDILLITKFASMEDMDAYLVHPVHVEVSKYILKVMETGAAVCYKL